MIIWSESNPDGVHLIVDLVSIAVGALTILLTPINILAWRDTRRQAQAAEEGAEASWKQIHADRVAEIFKTLRKFEWFVVHSGKVGPGKDFSDFGNVSVRGGKVCEEYLDLQEAFYLSRLISEPLFEFMRDRMADADGLQRINDPEVFEKKLREFHENWDVYKLASKLRELT